MELFWSSSSSRSLFFRAKSGMKLGLINMRSKSLNSTCVFRARRRWMYVCTDKRFHCLPKIGTRRRRRKRWNARLVRTFFLCNSEWPGHLAGMRFVPYWSSIQIEETVQIFAAKFVQFEMSEIGLVYPGRWYKGWQAFKPTSQPACHDKFDRVLFFF